MAVTTLDPQDRTGRHRPAERHSRAAHRASHWSQSSKQAVALLDAFRRHRLPVVLVNVAGGAPGRTEQPRHTGGFPADWADLVPELKQQPEDHLVTKHTWGAFTNTDLERICKSKASRRW